MGEPVVTALVSVWEIFGPTVVNGWIARCGMRSGRVALHRENGEEAEDHFGEYDRQSLSLESCCDGIRPRREAAGHQKVADEGSRRTGIRTRLHYRGADRDHISGRPERFRSTRSGAAASRAIKLEI
jgi:hypothetical protein